MHKILFICQANVGRSQMAEAFYNFHTNSHNAISAAVEDYREKYNHRPVPEIIKIMLEKQIDISNQQIDFLDQEILDSAEITVVLCAKELCPDFLIKSSRAIFREVEDPFELDENTIRRIRDEIEELMLEIIGEG